MKKRTISVILSLVFMICCVLSPLGNISIFLDDSVGYASGTYDKLIYILYPDHAELARFEYPPPHNITIPSEIRGIPVTTINKGAFSNCTDLQTLVIPDTVTSIGENAFMNCEFLSSITIPDSVKCIAGNAFRGCSSLKKIDIPQNATWTGDFSFTGCSSLESITIPDYVSCIIGSAFSGCSSLESVVIPKSIKSIEMWAFKECYSLKSIVIPESVSYIGKWAFQQCIGLESVSLPSSIDVIDYGTFYDCSSLKTITIPNSVKSIDDSAFYNCSSLESISIPNTITSIGDGSFSFCSKLASVDIPDYVKSIGVNTFSSCSNLESITIRNVECDIYDSKYTIANDTKGFSGTIYGYSDSTAEEYAKKYGYKFDSLGDYIPVTTTTTTTTSTTTTTTYTTTNKIPKTTIPEARDNYCNIQDNEEATYKGSYWVQPSAWGTTKIDPNAYNGNGAEIKISKITVKASNAPDSFQTVKISYNGPEKVVSSIALHILWDTRMEIQEYRGNVVQDAKEALNGFATQATELKPGLAEVVSAAGGDELYTGEMYSMTFKLPANAKAGDLYPIGIVYKYDDKFGDLFYNAKQNDAGKLHMAYVFTQGIENGYIKVVDDNATTTSSTTTTTTTTTTYTTTNKIPKTTIPEARDNYCNIQDNEEATYKGSYWVQPSAWGTTKIDPNAYNGNGAEIKISKITVKASNAPDSFQTVKISYNGPEKVVSSIAFHILWDTRMEIQEYRRNVVQDANDALNGFSTLATEVKPGIVAVVSSAGGDDLYAGDMYTMTFKLPTNAKAGDLYPIGIVYKYDEKFGDLFYNANQNNAGKLHMAYVFTQGIENGYIKVVADNTTSTTTTTTTTTITTNQPQIEDYDLGDVNNDGTVDGSDATWVLREFGNVLAGKGESFTPEQFKAGDVDLNGVIDGSDATLILKFFGEAGKDINVSYGGMQLWMNNNFWNKDINSLTA